jgi:aspartate racemase
MSIRDLVDEAAFSQEREELLAILLEEEGVNASQADIIKPMNEVKLPLLSFAQQRLWFLEQLLSGTSSHNITKAFRLTGSLNVTALELSLVEIVSRHEILRTTFSAVDGQPVQVISSQVALTLPVLDLQELPESEQEAEVQRGITDAAQQLFDLSQGPLLHVQLLCLSKDCYMLLLTLHHIVFDGWSFDVFFRELTALYSAFSTDQLSPLPKLTIQYADFAHWQRGWLQGEVLESQLKYWKKQLGENLPNLQLPTDYPRPSVQTYPGAYQSLELSKDLTESLKTLSKQEKVTLFMTLLAAFQTLLSRYSRQEDIIVGTPIAGRNQVETEELIGFFVNTIAIRTDLSGDPNFRQLLSQVREITLGAYDHQDLPLQKLIEELNPERDLSRSPLFQVMFAFQNTPSQPWDLPGVTITPLEVHSGTSKYDLTLDLRETSEGIKGGIEYNTDLFKAGTIARMLGHFQVLLEGIVSNPEQHLSDLPLLTQAEQHQLLVEWQNTQADFPNNTCIYQLFEAQVECTPDAIALIFEDQQLTYKELNVRANQLAYHLITLGVGPESIVAVCLDRSIELIVALLAVLKAGGAYLPLDSAWPQSRQELLCNAAGCSVLLSATGLVALSASKPASSPVTAGSLAYVIATSGTTGTPKTVAVEHGAILRLFDPANGFFLEPGTRLLQLAPLAFDAATFEIWGPLLHGGTLVIAPSGQLSLSEIATLLREQHITTLWLTAGLFHSMVDAELHSLAGVRQVLAGGDVLSPEHVQRLLLAFPPGHQLINGYGPTENTTFTCCHHLVAGDSVDPAGVPIGRPIAGTTVRILNGFGQPCPIGIPGELHIGGAGLARGYLNNPELTAKTFIPDPFSSDPTARLYKSGDLASWNPDGTLAFHGRTDQQIKLRGFRIEPGEIEDQLLTHPAVAQSVVVLCHDDPNNPRLIAYWVADASQPTLASSSSEQLRAFLAERLPVYMVPAAFLQLEALPLTTNGKIDRKALPAPSFSGNPGQRVEPSTDLERQLHAIWAEVLGHSDFDITDNFFAIGGHSLAAARLVSRINETFQCADPLLSFFKDPTIRGQVGILSGVEDDRYSCIVPMQLDGDKPPLFIIHGFGGKISGWVHLARAFAPDRPVFGVQSFGADHNLGPQGSIEEMTERYAAEILRKQPSGIIHLMGYSAGGWYAHAVAKALLERGGHIGMLALLDTYPTTRTFSKVDQLTRFIGLLTRRTGFHVKALVAPSRDQGSAEYIIQRYASLGFHTRRMLGFELPFTSHLFRNGTPKPEEQHKPVIEIEPFVRALDQYTPLSIPIHADIFAPLAMTRRLDKFWRRYVLQGVTAHPMFQDHRDYLNSELASELHVELERAMSAKDR